MNKVMLVGRLTKDPEVRYTTGENAMAIARFSVAVDRRMAKKDAEQTADFPSIVAFGKTAEFVEKYFKKGMRIGIAGRIQTGSYEKDGVKHYTTDVVADEVEFVESKNDGNNKASDSNYVVPSDEIEDNLPF